MLIVRPGALKNHSVIESHTIWILFNVFPDVLYLSIDFKYNIE